MTEQEADDIAAELRAIYTDQHISTRFHGPAGCFYVYSHGSLGDWSVWTKKHADILIGNARECEHLIQQQYPYRLPEAVQ